MNVDPGVNNRAWQYTLMYTAMKSQMTAVEAEDFGKRLRKAMQRMGISLGELSKEVDCTKGTLSKWVNGKTRTLDYVLARRVAICLGTTPEALRWESGSDPWLLQRSALAPPRKRG